MFKRVINVFVLHKFHLLGAYAWVCTCTGLCMCTRHLWARETLFCHLSFHFDVQLQQYQRIFNFRIFPKHLAPIYTYFILILYRHLLYANEWCIFLSIWSTHTYNFLLISHFQTTKLSSSFFFSIFSSFFCFWNDWNNAERTHILHSCDTPIQYSLNAFFRLPYINMMIVHDIQSICVLSPYY